MKALLALISLTLFFNLSSTSSFAKEVEIYSVNYPPFIFNEKGPFPEYVTELNKELKDKNLQFKLKTLPLKRLIKKFEMKEINAFFLTHSAVLYNQSLGSLLFYKLLSPLDLYAYTKDSIKDTKKTSKPKLAIHLGDQEENKLIGTGYFERIKVKDTMTMFKMLKGNRVNYINCLLPFCQYLATKMDMKLLYEQKRKTVNPLGFFFSPNLLTQKEKRIFEQANRKLFNGKIYHRIFRKMCNQYDFDCKQFLNSNVESLKFHQN